MLDSLIVVGYSLKIVRAEKSEGMSTVISSAGRNAQKIYRESSSIR